MIVQQHPLKQAAKVALAALAVLFVGSVVFYKERIFFGDASFLVFNIINYKSHYIQWGRYGSYATQFFPYIAQRLNLPIKSVLISYAASFYFFYFLAAVIVYRCKQYGLVVIMGLYYVLFFSDSYFWVSEVPQSIAWLFIYLSVTLRYGNSKISALLFFPLILSLAFLTISTHFVAIIPFTFLWVYFILEKQNWAFSKNKTIWLSAIPVVIIVTRFMMVGPDSGENSLLHSVTHFSIKDILLIPTTPVIKVFAWRCISIYWPAIFILITGIMYLVKTKKRNLMLWLGISVIGYAIIIGLAYGGFDENLSLFHIESEWGPIGILFATPFVFSFLPRLKISTALILLSLIFAVRFAYISMSIPKFRWRNEFKENVLSKMRKKGITKLALYNNDEIMSNMLIFWAVPEETLLSSAVNGDNPLLTFRFVNKTDAATLNSLKNSVGLSFNFVWLKPENTNSTYFKTDTTAPYQIMTYEELMK